MQLAFDIILRGILSAGPLALATLAIVLIFRTSFTTNFAQGMVGTVAAFVTTGILMWVPDVNGVVPDPTLGQYVLAIFAGMVVSVVISALIDIVIFRNSKRLSPVNKQIITMGMVLILSGIIPIVMGINDRSLPRIDAVRIGGPVADFLLYIESVFANIGLTVRSYQVVGFTISIIILGVIFSLLRFTKWGLGVRATASNEAVAGMMGINTKLVTAMTWAIAGGLGAVSAVLISSSVGTFGNVTTYFMTPIQVQAFFSSILGGFGTFHGPIVGVFIFNIAYNLFSVYLNPWGTTAAYLFVMLIVLIRPIGLFGKKVAKKV